MTSASELEPLSSYEPPMLADRDSAGEQRHEVPNKLLSLDFNLVLKAGIQVIGICLLKRLRTVIKTILDRST